MFMERHPTILLKLKRIIVGYFFQHLCYNFFAFVMGICQLFLTNLFFLLLLFGFKKFRLPQNFTQHSQALTLIYAREGLFANRIFNKKFANTFIQLIFDHLNIIVSDFFPLLC